MPAATAATDAKVRFAGSRFVMRRDVAALRSAGISASWPGVSPSGSAITRSAASSGLASWPRQWRASPRIPSSQALGVGATWASEAVGSHARSSAAGRARSMGGSMPAARQGRRARPSSVAKRSPCRKGLPHWKERAAGRVLRAA